MSKTKNPQPSAAERIVREFGFTPTQLDLVARILALETHPNVQSVSILYTLETQAVNRGEGWVNKVYRKPEIDARVILKKDFENFDEYRAFLEANQLPTKDSVQYCAKSYGIEHPEMDIDFNLEG